MDCIELPSYIPHPEVIQAPRQVLSKSHVLIPNNPNLREGKASVKSIYSTDVRKNGNGCVHSHAISCAQCSLTLNHLHQKQKDLSQRLKNKKEFSEKIKLFKGKSIPSKKENAKVMLLGKSICQR